MSETSALVKKLDEITSVIVRIKADWTCIACGRRYEPVRSRFNGLPRQNMLTTSHYFNRWRHSVRWDYGNLDAMCIFCHKEIEHKKKEDYNGFNYEEYIFNKLGQNGYEDMLKRSRELTFLSPPDLKKMLESRRREVYRLTHGTIF